MKKAVWFLAIMAIAASNSGCSSSSSAQGPIIPTETIFSSFTEIRSIAPVGSGKYVMEAIDGTSQSVYATDLTPAGTTLLMENALLLSVGEGTMLWHGRTFLLENPGGDTEQVLWMTDGTSEGTELLTYLEPGPLAFNVTYARLDGDRLILTGNPYDPNVPPYTPLAPRIFVADLD